MGLKAAQLAKSADLPLAVSAVIVLQLLNLIAVPLWAGQVVSGASISAVTILKRPAAGADPARDRAAPAAGVTPITRNGGSPSSCEPPDSPVTEAVRSLEVRWIFPGQLATAVAGWFAQCRQP